VAQRDLASAVSRLENARHRGDVVIAHESLELCTVRAVELPALPLPSEEPGRPVEDLLQDGGRDLVRNVLGYAAALEGRS
jgi:hypothetical protein